MNLWSNLNRCDNLRTAARLSTRYRLNLAQEMRLFVDQQIKDHLHLGQGLAEVVLQVYLSARSVVLGTKSDGIKVKMLGNVNGTLVVPLLRDHRY